MSFTPANPVRPDPVFINPWSANASGPRINGMSAAAPASATWPANNRAYYLPFVLARPYDLQRFFWQNGSTVGTDSLQAAIYTVDGSNTLDCTVSTARTLSAGTSDRLQYATCSVVAHDITSGNSTTDGTSFATASVTLKARPGVMYALSVVNTHGTSANAVTAATTSGAVTFTSRNTVTWGTSGRTTILTAVPTADVTDTITITIGSAQTATGCAWSLVAFTNVDTTTDHGIVQTATNSGSSTTPSATLAAFGSANNATFGAHGHAQSATTPGTGFIEVHDVTYATPTTGLETAYRSDNDTSVDATITSAAWGTVAAEIKSLGTTRILAPGLYYMALHCTGTTATVYRSNTQGLVPSGAILQQNGLSSGLPLTPSFTAATVHCPNFGITSRATP